MEVEEDVRETRANSADEIEEKVREVAEVVFHVVAEDPEEEHVTGYMEEAAMHEHAGEQGKKGGFEAAMTAEGQSNVVRKGGIGCLEGHLLAMGKSEFVEKHDDVRQDEKRVDDRIGPAGVQVFEGDEHAVGLVSRRLGESCAVSLALALQPFDFAEFRDSTSCA